MTIKMRLTSVLAASVLAASAGLVTGFAAAPAGAVPGPDGFEVCTEDCGPEPEEPEAPEGPGSFETCTEDCGPDDPEEPDGGGGSVDVPIPADANFTG